MDKTALGQCRNLLRLIECEAVTDTSDQNLFDILIRSEEKKTVLLTWLIQNLFTPEQCNRSSFSDLLSMFMTANELTNFLEGTMLVADQFKIWKLLMDTVHQTKIGNDSDAQSTTHRILSGKLLDELAESWHQKVKKPAVSLVAHNNHTPDLRSQVMNAEEQLKRLNSLPESASRLIADNESTKNEDSVIIRKFLDRDRVLNEKLNANSQLSSISAECSNGNNFLQELPKITGLKDIRRNLIQLHDIMDISKSFNQ